MTMTRTRTKTTTHTKNPKTTTYIAGSTHISKRKKYDEWIGKRTQCDRNKKEEKKQPLFSFWYSFEMNWDCLVKMLNKNWKAQQETTHIEFGVCECVFLWTNTRTLYVLNMYIVVVRSSSWKIEFTGKMVNGQHCKTINEWIHTQKNTTISFEMYLFPIFVENLFHFADQLNFSRRFVRSFGMLLVVLVPFVRLSCLQQSFNGWFVHTFVASVCTCYMCVCVRALAHAYSLFSISYYWCCAFFPWSLFIREIACWFVSSLHILFVCFIFRTPSSLLSGCVCVLHRNNAKRKEEEEEQIESERILCNLSILKWVCLQYNKWANANRMGFFPVSLSLLHAALEI